MKLCQHTTVSGLRCVVVFGLAHHLGCTGESRNDVEIPVLYFWPLWLGRLRRMSGQWLYIVYAHERGSRYCPWQRRGLFYCWGHRHVYASSASSTSQRRRQNKQTFSYRTSLLVQPSNQLPCNAMVGSTSLCLMQLHRPLFWFSMSGCLFSWRQIKGVNVSLESSRL